MKAGKQLQKIWESLMSGRSSRERQIIGWGGVVSFVLVLIFAVWMPLRDSHRRLERIVALERQHLAVMTAVKQEMSTMPAAAERALRADALRTVIETSARRQLNPATLEIHQEGETGLNIKLTRVSLNALLTWVDAMSKSHHVRLDFAALRRENGVVFSEIRFVTAEP